MVGAVFMLRTDFLQVAGGFEFLLMILILLLILLVMSPPPKGL
jgi:hypothetical protein